MTNHDHIASVTYIHTNEEYQPSLAERGMDLIGRHEGAVTVALGVLATAGLLLGAKGLEGGTNDPSRFTHDTNVTAVHFDEGANVRHDPFVSSDTPAISHLDKPIEISTPDGAFEHTERHNGTWVGVKVTDMPRDFDTKGDKDGIVWVNLQKASETTK